MYEIGPFEYSFRRGGKKVFCPEQLTVREGEFIVITGASGSGKSTLLQILKGIIPEYKSGELIGKICFNSKELYGEGFKKNLREILFLFQNPFSQLLYPNASEEFLFSMENFGFSKEQMDHKRLELEDLFELSKLWSKKTIHLSNGECQRLVLASLLAVNPSVLLLDEPTAFLDPQARREFYSVLESIKGTRTIIIVDHHVDEVCALADQVWTVSDDGELLNQRFGGTPLGVGYEWPVLKRAQEQMRLRLSHMYFHYKEQKVLLKGIQLSAASGDIVVVRGKNGKGKSTLLKIMAGLQKPLEGEVELTIDGKIISNKKIQNHAGFVFQNPETHFFYDTIAEELRHLPSSDREILTTRFFTGIDLTRSPFLLSEGEKRRLSLLMVIYQNRDLLFYDEPTFGQDKKSIAMICSMILSQKILGKIQFIISHDDQFIDSLGAQVYQLEDCRLKRL